MAKGKRKNLQKKGQINNRPDVNRKMEKKRRKVPQIEPTNSIVPVPVPLGAQACVPSPTNGSRADSQYKAEDKDKSGQISGFIFMCNGRTKPECYQYRVFGLPSGRKEEVEKIKKGSKLFLFDVDTKLLYGIYKASSAGKLDLEPAAFGGKFPAQVSFKIFKECLPLHERSFKQAILENYQRFKFRPELNGIQVKNLLSLFRPLDASSSAPLPLPMPNVAPLRAMPSSVMEHQSKPSARLPPPEDPYLGTIQQYSAHALPITDPQFVRQMMLTSQHGIYGTPTTADPAHPAVNHQGLPTLSDPYNPDRPYFPEEPARTVQEQYPRYITVQEMVPREQLIGLEGEYHPVVLQRGGEIVSQRDNVAGYYNSYPVSAAHDPSPLQPHAPASVSYPRPVVSYDPSLVQRYSAAPGSYLRSAVYDPPLVQSHAPASYQLHAINYDPSLVQSHAATTSGSYRNPAVAYDPPSFVQSHGVASGLHPKSSFAYDPSLVQPRAPAPGSYTLPAVAYNPSLMQSNGSASARADGSLPVSSYYSFAGATRLIR